MLAVLATLPASSSAAKEDRRENRRRESDILVAYFSRSGNTRVVAGLIQRALEGIPMRWKLVALCLSVLASGADVNAQVPAPATAQQVPQTQDEKDVLELSRQKWLWMAERNTNALDKLMDPQAIFVHMGATFSKSEELGVIESGRIQYKQADVHEVSVRIIGDTAIVLSKIQLFALVGGNEARNPFSVTETYVKQAGAWKLGALAFTRLINQ